MQINIESPHLKIFQDLQNTILAKVSSLERLFAGITGCEIIVRKVNDSQNRNYEMEARIIAPKASFFCRERAGSFEVALGQLIENLSGQLRREKKGRIEMW